MRQCNGFVFGALNRLKMCHGHFLAAETFLTTGATVVARLSRQLCIQSPMKHPLTPDKRYLVVRGRLWRAANPALSPEVRKACVDRLMTARRAVRDALRSADDEALAAFRMLTRSEGIIPALESSHAVAYAVREAASLPSDHVMVVNLSGRGDKDLHTVAAIDKITI